MLPQWAIRPRRSNGLPKARLDICSFLFVGLQYVYTNYIINQYLLYSVRLFLFIPESVLRIEFVQFLACSKFFGFARVMRMRPDRARAQETMF